LLAISKEEQEKKLKKIMLAILFEELTGCACEVAENVGKMVMLANSIEEQGYLYHLYSIRGRHINFFGDRGRRKKNSTNYALIPLY